MKSSPACVRKTFSAWCVLASVLAFSGAGCDSPPDARDGIETVESALTSGAAKINCGGAAVSPFIADTDFTGGSTVTRANTIDLSAAYNPAPASVYQSQRYGNFSYTVPGFTASSWNQVRLHFADTHWTAAGARVFNVTINGKPVLKNFDIIATVGKGNKALVESFTMQASSSGQYVIQFTTVTDAATVSAIEVFSSPWSGTPTTLNGTAYANQCTQQMVPLPPPFGGSGTCAACFAGSTSCVGCTAGAWKYSGQVSSSETEQSFNEPSPVDIFYWETAGVTPGLCMMAARQSGETEVDFHGVICQAASGAVCYWDLGAPGQLTWNVTGGTTHEQGHVVIPTTAKVITSKTSIPSPPAFVGGSDLVLGKTAHSYQNECSDCHAGRNAFNNHPGTATDLNGRGLLTSATDWFPMAWPAPIVPAWDPGASALGAPWPKNPGPEPTTGFSGTACFGCHTEGQIGGLFPAVSQATSLYCGVLITQAVQRTNNDCPNTFPWNPSGSPSPDINCPTGAMPPSSGASLDSLNDPFALGMLSHQTGQCNAEFRTQLAPPPGGGTLANAAGTVSTMAFSGGFQQATTFGIGSANHVMTYDPTAMKWITTNGLASQLSVGRDGSVWAIKQSGSTSFMCATSSTSCGSSGTCAWTCDSSGRVGYVQVVAGSGDAIWAVDAGKHVLWAYFPSSPGQYTADGMFAMGEWPIGDPIAQVTVGGDGDMWVLSANGNISHQYGGPFNGAWTTVPAPAGGTVVSLAAANADDVWAASSAGLFRFVSASNSWEHHCPTTGCSGVSFMTVAAGGDSATGIAEVWALDTSGNAYRVDRTKPSTVNSMSKIAGTKLTQISVGGQGDVMGISSTGTVYTFQ